MISKQPTGNSTSPEFLEDFKDDLYKNVLHIKEPVTSARSYLRKSHRRPGVESVDKALNLNPEKRDALLDALTDLVANKSFNIEDWEEREKEIEEIFDDFKIFEKLDGEFKRFNKPQQEQILKKSFQRILQEASKLEEAVRMEMVEGVPKEERRALLMLGQVFEVAKKLTSVCLNNEEYTSESAIELVMLFLELEALRREKIDYEGIEETIYRLGSKYQDVEPLSDDSIFEVLQ